MPHAGGAPKGKPHAKHDRHTYEALVSAYREQPGRHNHAAEYAGCSRGCARNAYEKGWPHISWAKPIKDRLAAEGDEAERAAGLERLERLKKREERLAQEDAAAEAARQARLEATLQEGEILKLCRKGVQQAAATVLAITPAVAQLVRVVRRAVEEETVDPVTGRTSYKPKDAALVDAKVSPMAAMKLIKQWGDVVGKATLAGEVVIQVGREMRGPEEPTGVADIPLEEAMEDLRHVMDIARSLEESERGGVGDQAPPGTPIN